jgi:hypothetical protein
LRFTPRKRNSFPFASYSLPSSTKKPLPVLYDGRDTVPPVGAPVVTATVALCEAEAPVALMQSRVYMVVLVTAPVRALPLVAWLPVHPPEALQAVALLEDQVKVDVSPFVTLAGLAFKVTVSGESATETVADWDAEPPVPVHVRPKLVVVVSGTVLCEPLIGRAPLQPPDAVQVRASAALHFKVTERPAETVLALGDSVTTGAAPVEVPSLGEAFGEFAFKGVACPQAASTANIDPTSAPHKPRNIEPLR